MEKGLLLLMLLSFVAKTYTRPPTLYTAALGRSEQRRRNATERNALFFESGFDTTEGNGSARIHSFVFRRPEINQTELDSSLLNIDFTADIVKNTGFTLESLRGLDNLQRFLRRNFPVCLDGPPSCPGEVNSYRTPDGVCNNLKTPNWGRAHVPQKRLLTPDYADDIGAPRRCKMTGNSLPSTRLISNTLHRDTAYPEDTLDSNLSYWFMQFGQFLDHDMVKTPILTGKDGAAIDCCATESQEKRPEFCFPIPIPEADPYFSDLGITCINLVRSAPAKACPLLRRQQINAVTSYIDGSMVYGSSLEEQLDLRSLTDGFLKTNQSRSGNQRWLPPHGNRNEQCVFSSSDTMSYCHKAGDVRVNENPTLTAIHTLFVREHNRVATALKDDHPLWDDEKLFQQSRKIVAAVIQHITYNEYLPTVLGSTIMDDYNLSEGTGAHSNVYDDTVDATITNSFASATFRFGHSSVRKEQKRMSEENEERMIELSDSFFNPKFSQTSTSINGMTRWMNRATCAKSDGFFSKEIRDKLFKDDTGTSLDLAALNIQRGRDHGLPSYNSWRTYCGLTPFNRTGIEFDQACRADHVETVAQDLIDLYATDEDIDLYAGAITETLLPGAQVGPLFACLLATEFRSLKVGDRYYFENNTPQRKVGFTEDQVTSIKGYSFAKLICTNSNTPTIQANIFRILDDDTNPSQDCSSLPDINFKLW